MLSIQWAWFWWLERGIFISILAEAYRPKENDWFSWQLLWDDSWVTHFLLARFFLTLNMRNQTMSGFYTEKKASKHYVYMKIKLFYPILAHSWCELSKGNDQAYIDSISSLSFSVMTMFLLKSIFRTFCRNFIFWLVPSL